MRGWGTAGSRTRDATAGPAFADQRDEDLDELGVELDAALAAELLDRLGRGSSRPCRAAPEIIAS